MSGFAVESRHARQRAVVTVVSPAVMPVSLEEAKAWLRVDHADEDQLIGRLIGAAVAAVEADTRTRLITQVVELRAASFAHIAAPRIGPVQEATSLFYIDPSGLDQLLDDSMWRLTGGALAPRIELVDGQYWPDTARRGDAVRLELVVGYGDTGEEVPENVRLAIQLLVTQWYDNRDQTSKFAGDQVRERAALASLLSPYTLQSIS